MNVAMLKLDPQISKEDLEKEFNITDADRVRPYHYYGLNLLLEWENLEE